MGKQLTSKRPYLLRAMHEWMTGNGQTPHVVVDAECPKIVVPQQHVQHGKIILNIGYSATRGLELGNEVISFGARFGGAPFEVTVPVKAVLGIYAKESGQGMIFSNDASEDKPVPIGQDAEAPTSVRSGKPNLRVIK
jgi:stringent starvation protein B